MAIMGRRAEGRGGEEEGGVALLMFQLQRKFSFHWFSVLPLLVENIRN